MVQLITKRIYVALIISLSFTNILLVFRMVSLIFLHQHDVDIDVASMEGVYTDILVDVMESSMSFLSDVVLDVVQFAEWWHLSDR